jgi:putative SOS response-associated peptidase YedK
MEAVIDATHLGRARITFRRSEHTRHKSIDTSGRRNELSHNSVDVRTIRTERHAARAHQSLRRSRSGHRVVRVSADELTTSPRAARPVIRYGKTDGANVVDLLTWGFRRTWAKRAWINARSETLFTNTAFTEYAKKRRCLVIATGPAILTAPASPTLERIHDRMPLVMHPANYAAWLNPNTENPADLMRPFDDGRLEAYPVSTFVNDPKNDAPASVEQSG